MKIEIKSWPNGSVLFSGDFETVKECLEKANLSGADLSGADLSGAYLSKANLSGANLSRADLSKANLSGADLSRANISRANLSWADLSGAYLSKANLSRADISRAYLSGVNLSGANLSGVNLSGANLSGANIDKKYCFLSISPIGSENGCLWVMKNEEGILMYNRGCFNGTEDEFLSAVEKKHGDSEIGKKYRAAVEFIKFQVGAKCPA